MYTKGYLEVLKASLVLPNVVGVSSIRYEVKSNLFYTTKRSKRKLAFVTAHFILIALFGIYRTYQSFGEANSTNTQMSYVLSFILAGLSFVLIVLNLVQDNLVNGLNQWTRFFMNFESRWMPDYKDNLMGLMRVLLIGQIVFCAIAPITATAHYFYFPKTPVYLPTLFFSEWEEAPIIHWSFSLIVTYHACCMTQVIQFWGVFLSIIYPLAPTVQREFRVGAPKQKSVDELRTVANLPLVYKCGELLTKRMLGILGYFICGLHAALGQFILYCNVTVIKEWTNLGNVPASILILWSFMGQIIWVAVLEIGGRFHEDSKRTLRSWSKMEFSSSNERKYMGKFRKACRPLKLGAEGLFGIKRLTVLKFMRALVKGTFKALMTLRKK